MDDLYANAWSDPSEPPLPELKPSTSTSTTWLSPRLGDEEADLAAPTWSSGAETHWNKPSEHTGFSWTQSVPDAGWGTNTYQDIETGKPAAEEAVPPTAPDEEAQVTAELAGPETRSPSPQEPAAEDETAVVPSRTEAEILSEAVLPQELAVLSPAADQDAFGTFESAVIPNEDAALKLEENEANADAWGSAWTSGPEGAEEGKPVDEWEAARQQKARRDRRVPPEVLAGILQDCDQFLRDAWPDSVRPTRQAATQRHDAGEATNRQDAEKEDAKKEGAEKEGAEKEGAEKEDAEKEDAEEGDTKKEGVEKEGAEKDVEKENAEKRDSDQGNADERDMDEKGKDEKSIDEKDTGKGDTENQQDTADRPPDSHAPETQAGGQAMAEEDAEPESATEEPTASTNTIEDEWRNNWRSGLEGVEGLEPFVQKILPPLNLLPPPQLGKTAIGRRMATSVRLTKNLALTRGSPMSHYLAARGSTAWEVSVKGRKEVVEDDVPVGWRILEKDAEHPTETTPAADAGKEKRPGSRLFSFWGKKDSGMPQQASNPPQTASESHSRQASRESVKTTASASVDSGTPSGRSTPPPAAFSPTASQPTAASEPPAASRPSSMSYADAPVPAVETVTEPQAPAPSAVSRFLNRFSRRRSAMGTASKRSSLALSSDDLEFLSDIVPSASDYGDEDAHEVDLKALTNMVKPTPLPPILPPPPSAPPRTATTNSGPNSASGSNSGKSPLDDFDSFFDALEEKADKPAPAPLGNAPPLKPTMTASVLEPLRPSSPAVRTTSANIPARSSSPAVEPAKPPSQPFFLPSPPSSRSQTPVSSTSSVAAQPSGVSTGIDGVKPAMGGSKPSVANTKVELKRPAVSERSRAAPPSFPPPRATARPTDLTQDELSPGTPTSSLPLAQLYPNAVRARSLNAARFAIPPPPSSHTQMSAPLPPPLAPPPSSQVFKPAQRSNTSNILDDDDFSDFLSSSNTKPSQPIFAPTVMTASHSTTSAPLPPPAANRSQTAPSVTIPPQIPPVPSTLQHTASSRTAPSAQAFTFDDDDEFSEFTSSATSLHPPTSLFDSPAFSDLQSSTSTSFLHSWPAATPGLAPSETSFSVEKSFLTPGQQSGFDDSLPSPVLRTPSPPRPISKTTSASSDSRSQPGSSPTSSRLQRASSHLQTLNLMERAAARPGRWPAPPSPLPAPIPGPGSSSTAQVDLLGDEGSPVRPDYKGVPASTSSPAMLGPVRSTSATTKGLGIGIQSVPILPPPMSQFRAQSSQGVAAAPPQNVASLFGNTTATAAVPPTSTAKTGGLSAQDLLFFEGL